MTACSRWNSRLDKAGVCRQEEESDLQNEGGKSRNRKKKGVQKRERERAKVGWERKERKVGTIYLILFFTLSLACHMGDSMRQNGLMVSSVFFGFYALKIVRYQRKCNEEWTNSGQSWIKDTQGSNNWRDIKRQTMPCIRRKDQRTM